MKWILILIFTYGGHPATLSVEFDDVQACEAARVRIERTVKVIYLDCVPKGNT